MKDLHKRCLPKADLVLISIGSFGQMKNFITREYETKNLNDLLKCGFFVRRIVTTPTKIIRRDGKPMKTCVYHLEYYGNKACMRVRNINKYSTLEPCNDKGCLSLSGVF